MVYWWWDRKTWGALRAADWRGIHQRKNHRFQPCLHPSLLETLAKKHVSLSPKKWCVFYHPNAGCLLDQWHGIFKLYYHMLPVFFPGFPENSGILGANTMVATVFQALGPYSPLLCQHPSLSFDKKMEDMKAPPGWDGWSWAWDGMEPGNTWWTEWWIWHLRFLYQSTCIILIYIYIYIYKIF